MCCHVCLKNAANLKSGQEGPKNDHLSLYKGVYRDLRRATYKFVVLFKSICFHPFSESGIRFQLSQIGQALRG